MNSISSKEYKMIRDLRYRLFRKITTKGACKTDEEKEQALDDFVTMVEKSLDIMELQIRKYIEEK